MGVKVEAAPTIFSGQTGGVSEQERKRPRCGRKSMTPRSGEEEV